MNQCFVVTLSAFLSACLFFGCNDSEHNGDGAVSIGVKASPESELEKFQGEWRIGRVIWWGEDNPSDNRLLAVWFNGNTMSIRREHGVLKSEVILDPSSNPASIDIKPKAEEALFGIYRFDADALYICFNALGRPRSFEVNSADNDPGLVLLVLNRQ